MKMLSEEDMKFKRKKKRLISKGRSQETKNLLMKIKTNMLSVGSIES